VPQLSTAEMRAAIERHVELWNEGDKEAWVDHMKRASVGGLTANDPVGTPTKTGSGLLGLVYE